MLAKDKARARKPALRRARSANKRPRRPRPPTPPIRRLLRAAAPMNRAPVRQAALPVQAAAPAPAAPAHPRTAQETCAGGNLITQGICEARECARREHTDEPLCTRLRAADDKRRQQD